MNPTFFADQDAFRRWLAKNHMTETQILVGFYKVSSGKPCMTWPESVDQFGALSATPLRIGGYKIMFNIRYKNQPNQ